MSLDILAQLRVQPKLDRKAFLANYVINEFKKTLFYSKSDSIDVHASVFDLGLNSLGLETLKQRFEEELECKIESMDFFANPTINYFIDGLFNSLFGCTKTSEQADVDTYRHDMVNSMVNAMYDAGKKK